MTARREVRGWTRFHIEYPRSGGFIAVHDWALTDDDTPVVVMHADDHAALLAEVERLRDEVERRVDENTSLAAQVDLWLRIAPTPEEVPND